MDPPIDPARRHVVFAPVKTRLQIPDRAHTALLRSPEEEIPGPHHENQPDNCDLHGSALMQRKRESKRIKRESKREVTLPPGFPGSRAPRADEAGGVPPGVEKATAGRRRRLRPAGHAR